MAIRLSTEIHYDNALVSKNNGAWMATSTKSYIEQANAISRGLLRMGVNIMDIGVLQLGAQTVPIYPTISEDDYEYVLNHSEAKFCFVSCGEVLDKVLSISGKTKKLQDVFSFDDLKNCNSWKQVLEKGKDDSNQEEVVARIVAQRH